MTQPSLLGDLIDAIAALDTDDDIDLNRRRQRDRTIGRELQYLRGKPATQVRTWVQHRRQSLTLINGARGIRLYHALGLVLVLIGLLSGWGLAAAVLSYDGKQPINIVNAVVLLVLPQILLLLLWLLSSSAGRLPWLQNLGAVLGFLNPGRLASHIASRFGTNSNDSLSMLWYSDHAKLLAPVARWLFSFWSQLFALSFNIGALLCAFFLVTSSDLAFVWSTTLTISDQTFHQLLSTLSTPWSSLLPNAAPTLDLVSASRYYRLEEGSLSGMAANPQLSAALGQWWRFLLVALTCYGLLPRLFTLGFSWYRLRYQLRKALCNISGAPELLSRMNSPLVSTSAIQPEQALVMTPPNTSIKPAVAHQVLLQGPIIDWSGACNDQHAIHTALTALGVQMQEFLPAGGKQSSQQDSALIKSLCRNSTTMIAIIVKAWEPPMLDIMDFIIALRQQCKTRTSLIVLLWGGEGKITSTELETWECTLAQLNDPQLHVECLGQNA